jgi:DNA-binding NarL/FixJ family response regulator
LTRVAVILHERRGNWAGQLRTRLQDRPVRWIETRSAADLDAALLGLACPVVLIDLRNHAAQGLDDLDRAIRQSPAARVLVVDPDANEGVVELARELGASLAISGFVPPPDVASLIDRWIKLAAAQTEREGWSRGLAAEPPFDVESLLELALIELADKTDNVGCSPVENLPSNPPPLHDGHTA